MPPDARPDTAMEPFPLMPAAFSGQARKVPRDAPFNWLAQGWAVFLANPGVWVLMTAFFLAVILGLQFIPVVGGLIAALLLPLLLAGMLHGVRRLVEADRLGPTDLLAGLRHHPGPLLKLGLVFMAGWLLITLVVGAIIGGGVTGFLLAVMLKLLFGVPLCLALWFAPALVHFNEMPPVQAMQASFSAYLRNGLAMLAFSVVAAIIGFFAILPAGIGLLVLIPVLTGALYASHKDIFLG